MMYKKCAERDGEIDCGEQVRRSVDFAMLIWGSIVVFGAWATWTDDFDAYKANPEELNFCAHTPMMTAFVILILNWVLIPVMIACACCFACCALFGVMFAASSQQNQS